MRNAVPTRASTTGRAVRRLATVVSALLILATAVVGAPSLAGAASRHTHHRTHHHGSSPHSDSQPALLFRRSRSTSQNWSGYVARGGPFTSVAGTWSIPAVDCGTTPDGVAAIWVGIDGSGSRTVEQTGTFGECDHGTPSYAAWYEAYPARSIIIDNPVAPGDVMHATVTNTGPQNFDLVLSDQTKGWSSTNHITVRGRLVSAEAIAEAPSVLGQLQPLADFGSVGFTGVTVNGQPLANSHPLAVTMAAPGGIVKAVPGALSGGDFTVGWRHI